MLQNISQKRDNKAITLTDFRFIRCAASLSIYNGILGYAISGSGSSARRYVGHFMSLYVYYYKEQIKIKVNVYGDGIQGTRIQHHLIVNHIMLTLIIHMQ